MIFEQPKDVGGARFQRFGSCLYSRGSKHQEAVHSAWMARVGICCGGDENFQLLRYYFTLTLNNVSLIVLIIYHEP